MSEVRLSAPGTGLGRIDRARSRAAEWVTTGGMAVRYLRGDALARLAAPANRAHPFPTYRRIRERGPWVPTMAGPMSTRYAVVDAVLRDHATFGNAPEPDVEVPAGLVERLAFRVSPLKSLDQIQNSRFGFEGQFVDVPDPLGPESLLGMNAPDHTRLRRLVSRAFTPRAVAGVRARVEAVADELLDRAGPGEFEVMSGYAGVLPVVVISELLGIPQTDWERLKVWGDVLASSLDAVGGAPEAVVAPARREFATYITDLVARRRHDPGGQVIDTLIEGSDGDGLTDRELLATAMLLLVAGFETTVNLVGSGVVALLEHPAELDRLRSDPSLAENLVHEVLRYESPVQLTSRTARRDVELAGLVLPRGSQLVCSLGGANRDPEVFPDPDRFDLGRPNARAHLAFSAGVHHCLGAALARLEGEVALGALVRRHPDLRLAAPVVRGRGLILRGPRRVSVHLGAAA